MDFKSIFTQYLNLVGRIVPRPARVPVLGIDIGTNSIKAVEIAGTTGNLEIRQWAVERIENSDVKSALQKIIARLRLTNQIPVTAVSGKGTLIRYIDLPRMPLEDLRKSFIYELDKYFPFDPQTIYSDCHILDSNSKDKKMSVLVAAAKKEMVEERLKLFKDIGLSAGHLTINSIAVINAFEASNVPMINSEHAKAILDIGGSASNLMILKNRLPCFTRDIYVGSQDLTKQIANALGVTSAEAEQLKLTPGDKHDQVIEACDTSINNLIAEIRLSIDYFMTERNAQIDEVFLVGGGSLLKGIEVVFEKNLGMPVKIWNPLEGLHLGPQVAAVEINAHSSQLGVAIGLGLINT